MGERCTGSMSGKASSSVSKSDEPEESSLLSTLVSLAMLSLPSTCIMSEISVSLFTSLQYHILDKASLYSLAVSQNIELIVDWDRVGIALRLLTMSSSFVCIFVLSAWPI